MGVGGVRGAGGRRGPDALGIGGHVGERRAQLVQDSFGDAGGRGADGAAAAPDPLLAKHLRHAGRSAVDDRHRGAGTEAARFG